MKTLALLGSTGSIGTQTLQIVDWKKRKLKVNMLTANRNWKKLSEQINKYKPKKAWISKEELAEKVEKSIKTNTEILYGEKELLKAINEDESDVLLNAISGFAGFLPSLEAIKNEERRLALANKETLVIGGDIFMKEVKKRKIDLIPVDSEHSAIFQALKNGKKKEIEKIILTCSGGRFKDYTRKQLENVKPEEAKKHPRWNMGIKITIDSGTLVNKGFELIEAMYLFDVKEEDIEVMVHPQTAVHSGVVFKDGTSVLIAGPTTMLVPIALSLSYPERWELPVEKLKIYKEAWTFEKPRENVFEGLKIARKVAREKGIMGAIFNASDEVAVDAFLNRKIKFLEIYEVIKETLKRIKNKKRPSIGDLVVADKKAREVAREVVYEINERTSSRKRRKKS